MGGSSIKLLHTGNDFHIEFEYGDKSYMLFILMKGEGQNLMEMAFCMEGVTIDFAYNPENTTLSYSVECMDGRCSMACTTPYIFKSVWGMEIEQ